jgi:hypothetical protein
MSVIVEDEEEDGSNPMVAAAFLSRSVVVARSSSQVGDLHMTTCSGSLGFSSVDILDKSVEPLPKGLSLWV